VPVDQYPDARLKTFAEALTGRLRSLPDVRVAGFANQLPMVNLRDTAGGLWRTPDTTRRPAPDAADARFVSQLYFDVMGIRVIEGRGFRDHDRADQPQVLLVNQALVRREFAGQSPVGQVVYIGRDPNPCEIVGVVEDVRQFGRSGSRGDAAVLRGPAPVVGKPSVSGGRVLRRPRNRQPPEHHPPPACHRSRAGSTGGAVRDFRDHRGGARRYRHLRRAGLHRDATHERGIRMALGARPMEVMALVLRQSLAVTTAGILIGVGCAAGVTRFLEGMLFGLTPLDARTFVGVSLLFALVAALASSVPACRATRVDPVVALRRE
jgi:putative ABC transport system permease protein